MVKYQLVFEIEAEHEGDVVSSGHAIAQAAARYGHKLALIGVSVERQTTVTRGIWSREYEGMGHGEHWQKLAETSYELEVLTRVPIPAESVRHGYGDVNTAAGTEHRKPGLTDRAPVD